MCYDTADAGAPVSCIICRRNGLECFLHGMFSYRDNLHSRAVKERGPFDFAAILARTNLSLARRKHLGTRRRNLLIKKGDKSCVQHAMYILTGSADSWSDDRVLGVSRNGSWDLVRL